jgi:hypothetical protein
MTPSPDCEPRPIAGWPARFPALAMLRLTDEDIAALGEQGFLAPERRQNQRFFKLRFRRGGRQVVRYVGGTEAAALVAEELKILQAARRARRELERFGRVTRQRLREAKIELEPLILESGFKFHGRAIRRPRLSVSQIDVTFSTIHDTEV